MIEGGKANRNNFSNVLFSQQFWIIDVISVELLSPEGSDWLI